MKPQGFDEFSDETRAVFAELERREAHGERINPEALTKLPKPLSIEAGECGTIKGVSLRDASAHDDEVAWSVLAGCSFEQPECAGEPLGYTDAVRNGERMIEVYWAKAV